MRAWNLAASWASVATSIAVAFIAAPILVGSLGKAGYGEWCVINALGAQLALVELGLIASANRELNGQVAANKIDDASSTLSTASVVLGGLTLTGTLFIYAGSYLTPIENDVRLALLVVLLAMAIKLANTPFISNLQCHERLDLAGVAQVATLTLRLGLVVTLADSLNVVTLSYIFLLSEIAGIVLIQACCRYVAPEIKFSIRLVRPQAVKRLKAIAMWTALKRFAQQVYTSVDTLIIGSIMSTTSVTTYSLGFVLPNHSENFTRQIGRVFSPKILKDAQLGELTRVAHEVRIAMILCAAVGTPIFLGIPIFGKDFFTLWMGEGFETAYYVASIFACLAFFRALHLPIHSALLGVGEVKRPAILISFAAVANIVLSVVLCHTALGILGVAIASVITIGISEAICIAIAFKHISVGATQYTRNLLAAVAMVVVFLVIGFSVRQIPGELLWIDFLAKCVGSVVAYSIVIWPMVAHMLKMPISPLRLRTRFA